ncbi:hypothetical protein BM449_05750 [Synechococcus sp. SynAce01]|nr:hypothetical protein BM449_05750 [Synechococcus sp. SynAce01]
MITSQAPLASTSTSASPRKRAVEVMQQVARHWPGRARSRSWLVWPCRKRSTPAPSSRITAAACSQRQGSGGCHCQGSSRRESPRAGLLRTGLLKAKQTGR